MITITKHILQSGQPNNSLYYYSLLTDEQQQIYETILSGITAFSKKIKIPLRPINEMSKIFNYVLLDNPLIFYTTSFSCQNDLYKKKSIFIPEYTYERTWVKEKTAVVADSLKAFDAVCDKNDYDKELYVHDYCLNNFTYDNAPDDMSHTVLGPILKNTAVCDGIAKYVKLALDYLGVKSIVVNGKAKSPFEDDVNVEHGWNVVEIGRSYYHLDVTSDMTLKWKTNRYDYFNLSDEDVKKDHTVIGDAPACTTSEKDYYSLNRMIIKRPAEAEELISSNLRKGIRNITFKIVDAKFSDKIVEKIKQIAGFQYGNICKSHGAINIICNQTQMVFEIDFG